MTSGVALIRGRAARAALPAPLIIAAGRSHTAETILRAWFEGKAEHTIRSYRLDLEDFALYFSRALAISPPMNVNAALKPAHLDHGYAVTGHSAQGATADRVIVHAESGQSAALVNERFAYVAGSRMREGLDVYTDNSQRLTSSLERQFDKTAALRGTDAAPRQEHGVNGHAKGATGATSRVEHQGQSAKSSPTGEELGHGR